MMVHAGQAEILRQLLISVRVRVRVTINNVTHAQPSALSLACLVL